MHGGRCNAKPEGRWSSLFLLRCGASHLVPRTLASTPSDHTEVEPSWESSHIPLLMDSGDNEDYKVVLATDPFLKDDYNNDNN